MGICSFGSSAYSEILTSDVARQFTFRKPRFGLGVSQLSTLEFRRGPLWERRCRESGAPLRLLKTIRMTAEEASRVEGAKVLVLVRQDSKDYSNYCFGTSRLSRLLVQCICGGYAQHTVMQAVN